MIPSFPSFTSAGPPPHRHTQVFFLSHDGIACFKHHGFGGLIFFPLQCGSGTSEIWAPKIPVFLPKRGAMVWNNAISSFWEENLNNRNQNMEKHGKNHLERKLVFFIDDESSAILRLNSFVFFWIQPFIGKRRSWHQSVSCSDILSLSLAKSKVIEGDQPMEIWMNLILY